MNLKSLVLFFFFLMGSHQDGSCTRAEVVSHQDLFLWTESFGNPKDPAVLLVMGSGCQSVLWPFEFCRDLAEQGYFVIRYDNRDTGLSSAIHYQKSPYGVQDMASDALAILDHYGLQSAHFIGLSLGGSISMMAAGQNPQRVKSLTLIATSNSFRSSLHAIDPTIKRDHLSTPSGRYLQWIKKFLKNIPLNEKQKIQNFMEGWKIINGEGIPLDEKTYLQIARQHQARLKSPHKEGNHFFALKSSFDAIDAAIQHIKAPTLILHGDKDPIVNVDHAESLKTNIKGAELKIIPGMGHAINPPLHELLITHIHNHLQTATQ